MWHHFDSRSLSFSVHVYKSIKQSIWINKIRINSAIKSIRRGANACVPLTWRFGGFVLSTKESTYSDIHLCMFVVCLYLECVGTQHTPHISISSISISSGQMWFSNREIRSRWIVIESSGKLSAFSFCLNFCSMLFCAFIVFQICVDWVVLILSLHVFFQCWSNGGARCDWIKYVHKSVD